ncbi:hypothetical protein AFLA_008704 [Aspergillus flavus NRRL3357]|nr:hypothetical protein AFLA_008704 [Aspergillus flavus NRRL3357]
MMSSIRSVPTTDINRDKLTLESEHKDLHDLARNRCDVSKLVLHHDLVERKDCKNARSPEAGRGGNPSLHRYRAPWRKETRDIYGFLA